jgi:hypothetical protein
VWYSNIPEKDVYQFMNIAFKNTVFSRDAIKLNMTYSQHMGISQVDFITIEVEDEDKEQEEVYELEGAGYVGPPPGFPEDIQTHGCR